MSFREKSAWTSLITYLVVYGYYFWRILTAASGGKIDSIHYVSLLIHLIVLLIFIQIVLTVLVTIIKPSDARAPRDELDKLISLKATRIGFAVIIVGALTAVAAIAHGAPAFYTANGLFLTIVVAEVARNIAQIVQYRMVA
jgi:magnesium-transporting ATPase (P-type)